jgi:hypothetical protein
MTESKKRTPTDYNEAKIYKIVCNVTNKCYYGSTCSTLKIRLKEHVRCFNKWENGKYHFTTSFDIIKNGDYVIELVEKFPCKIKAILHDRECFYIENNECINKIKPNKFNALGKQEYMKLYRQENKETLREQEKLYKQKHKKKYKLYRERNKDDMYAKVKILRHQKVTCECGSTVGKYDMPRHCSSKKHLAFTNM